MAQCQSPDELMKLISRIVDMMINQYLLCGTLQGGLNACGEESILPKGTEIVLCRQLYELVQEGIDTGKIIAPTVVEVRYDGSTLILHLANGENLSLDLKPLIDGVINQAFIDCDGTAIHVGTALATCVNLKAVEDKLKQNIDTNKLLSDQRDDAQDLALSQHVTDMNARLELLKESLDNKIDASVAEWANSVLENLLNLFLETRQVYHDESLTGDGHEASPLSVNVTWLKEQIKDYLPEIIGFVDCCGNPIKVGDVLVTCECLESQLISLTNELKAYAESEDAKVLEESKEYTDQKFLESKEYTDSKVLELENRIPDIVLDILAGYELHIKVGDGLLGTGTTADPVRPDEEWFNDRYVRNDILPVSRVGALTEDQLPINGSYFSVIYPYNGQNYKSAGYLEPNGDVSVLTPVTNGEDYRLTYGKSRLVDGTYAPLQSSDREYKIINTPEVESAVSFTVGTPEAGLVMTKNKDTGLHKHYFVRLNGSLEYARHTFIPLGTELLTKIGASHELPFINPVPFIYKDVMYILVGDKRNASDGTQLIVYSVSDAGVLAKVKNWTSTSFNGVVKTAPNITLTEKDMDNTGVVTDTWINVEQPIISHGINGASGDSYPRLVVAMTPTGIVTTVTKWLRLGYDERNKPTQVKNLNSVRVVSINMDTKVATPAKVYQRPHFYMQGNVLNMDTYGDIDRFTGRNAFAVPSQAYAIGRGLLYQDFHAGTKGNAPLVRNLFALGVTTEQAVVRGFVDAPTTQSRGFADALLTPPTPTEAGRVVRHINSQLVVSGQYNITKNLAGDLSQRTYNTVDYGVLQGANLTNDRQVISYFNSMMVTASNANGPVHYANGRIDTNRRTFKSVVDENGMGTDYTISTGAVALLETFARNALIAEPNNGGSPIKTLLWQAYFDPETFPTVVKGQQRRFGILCGMALHENSRVFKTYVAVWANLSGDITSVAVASVAPFTISRGVGMTSINMEWDLGTRGMAHIYNPANQIHTVIIETSDGVYATENASRQGNTTLLGTFNVGGKFKFGVGSGVASTDSIALQSPAIINVDGENRIGTVGAVVGASALYAFVDLDVARSRRVLGSARPAEDFSIIVASAIPVFMAGRQYEIEPEVFNLKELYNPVVNRTFYIYAQLQQGVAKIVVSDKLLNETIYTTYLGYARTDDIGIAQMDTNPVTRLDIYRPSALPIGSAIAVSNGYPHDVHNLAWDADNPSNP